MGNLVRKPNQVLFNSIDSGTLTYGATTGLVIKDYGFISINDEVVKFKKATTVAGTAKVVTVTPQIAYPDSAQDGAELLLEIRQVPDILGGSGAGKATNFHLAGKVLQGYLASLGAAASGYVNDTDIDSLINQIIDSINADPYLKDKITATLSSHTLVLTGASGFNFDVRMGQQYGSVAVTTAYVSPKLSLEHVQRQFPILPSQAGYPTEIYPDPTVSEWAQYYFKVKRAGYALDGANHMDEVYEEVRFYLPKSVAEASTGANWDNKIYQFLTAISYSDPDGDTSPWGLVHA